MSGKHAEDREKERERIRILPISIGNAARLCDITRQASHSWARWATCTCTPWKPAPRGKRFLPAGRITTTPSRLLQQPRQGREVLAQAEPYQKWHGYAYIYREREEDSIPPRRTNRDWRSIVRRSFPPLFGNSGLFTCVYRQSHSSSSSSFVLLSPPTTFSYHISPQIFEIILTLIETILNLCLKKRK